jgi:hypothetical protein
VKRKQVKPIDPEQVTLWSGPSANKLMSEFFKARARKRAARRARK